MTKIIFEVYKYKKLDDPTGSFDKFVGYVSIKEIIKNKENLNEWNSLNPREQNLNTSVSKAIKNSLIENNNFHLINRGILFSVKESNFDNKTNLLTIIFDNPELHGNIDGGHTLKTVMELGEDINNIDGERYLFFELIKGIEKMEEAIQLAEARNTSAPVDSKSIENLKGSFDVLKDMLKDEPFFDRIAWTMFQKVEDKQMIDVRDIISLMNVFNNKIFDPQKNDHPIVSYSGKEAGLRRFISKYNAQDKQKDSIEVQLRNEDLLNKIKIWKKIFILWDTIEKELSSAIRSNGKHFLSRYDYLNIKEWNSDDSEEINKINLTKWYEEELKEKVTKARITKKVTYTIPNALIYPLIASFRVLINKSGNDWDFDPIDIWENNKKEISLKFWETLEGVSGHQAKFGKNISTWENLYNWMKAYKRDLEIKSRDLALKKMNNKFLKLIKNDDFSKFFDKKFNSMKIYDFLFENDLDKIDDKDNSDG